MPVFVIRFRPTYAEGFKKRFLMLLQLGLLFPCLFGFGVVRGETFDDTQWESIETKHTIIRYQSLTDLKQFNHRMNYGHQRRGLSLPFFSSGSRDLGETVPEKVDLLFERVQEMLDMRKEMKKVTINLYHDKDQLQDAFYRIYKKPCHIRGCYRHQNNTVYINVKDLNEGILAHELAHAIVDNYLIVRPPRATAEILARHVDKHLKN